MSRTHTCNLPLKICPYSQNTVSVLGNDFKTRVWRYVKMRTTRKQTQQLMSDVTSLSKHVEILNGEMGETRDAITTCAEKIAGINVDIRWTKYLLGLVLVALMGIVGRAFAIF